MAHVKVEDLKYVYDAAHGRAVFEDGVIYSVHEMIYMARADADSDTLNAVHLVKKIFDGVIMMQEKPARTPGNREGDPSSPPSAVSAPGRNIRHG